jgi:hypothetical protein
VRRLSVAGCKAGLEKVSSAWVKLPRRESDEEYRDGCVDIQALKLA